ncbi:MAG: glycosyltransferase family 4 protein [Mangrovibacterium sp.]
MRVLMFGWEFPPHISGGLGTACYGLTKGLAECDDVEVLFVVPKAHGDEDQSSMQLIGANNTPAGRNRNWFENIETVPYVNPGEYDALFESEYGHFPHIHGNNGRLWFSGKYGAELHEEIYKYSLVAKIIARDNNFDLIHAHDWLAYPAGIAAKEMTGKPLVIHVHATDFDRSGGSVNPRVFAIEKWGMECADQIITVSNLTRNIVINKYGIDPNKVTTVYNAVEPVEQKESTVKKGVDEKIVTFLGRLTMQKGPEYFVEAAKMVLNKMDNVRFVMAGNGDMMDAMIQRAAELKISDKFNFTGFLKGDDVFNMFRQSDVFVMPSVSEPFGIVPLEAMQTNVPVIISYQSGCAEILEHALKVDYWDTAAMANAIYGVLKYPTLWKHLREEGKKEVDGIVWKKSAAHVREVYLEALNNR